MAGRSQQVHVTAADEFGSWSKTLHDIASAPLEFCPEFPRIAARWEAWWHGGMIDRPILVGSVNSDPRRPITKRLELLHEPDAWMETKLRDMQQLHRVGDALPNIRTDFGPVFLGALLGGALEFGADTSWTHAFIDDSWSNAPDWTILEDGPWWKRFRELTERVAQDAAGRYVLCTPDFGGSADVLLNLRSAEALCMDLVVQPEVVQSSIDAIYEAWRHAFTDVYRTAMRTGAGVIHWLGAWSNVPYMIPACDFCCMIGPDAFETTFLPDIARQAAAVGRALFHLDGPEAARHIDALLEAPSIQAIQFTPGDGSPSTRRWIDMFRKIQARGRSLLIICPLDEVLTLCDALEPEGLAFLPDARDVEQLDAVYAALCRRFGVEC